MGRVRAASGMLAFTALFALSATPAAAAAPGEIGGPPTYDVVGLGKPFKSFPKLPRARGKPIVIGTGTTAYGRVEIIGQASTKGVCVFVDYIDDGHSGGGPFSGHCPTKLPPEGAPASAWEFAYSDFGKPFLAVTGSARPDVASVQIAAENRGKRKTVETVVAAPDQALLERLKAPNPIVVYHAAFPACVPPHKTVSIARDASGAELGRSRGYRVHMKSFRPRCRKKQGYPVTSGYGLGSWGVAFEF